MLVSYDKKFLFLHNPKTAGTSFKNLLLPYSEKPELCWENRLLSRIGVNVNLVGPWRRRRFRGHCTALDVKRSIPAAQFQGLFKFGFVRNPWSMLVSLYNYIPTRPTHRYCQRVADMTFAEFADEWSQRPEILQVPRVCDQDGSLLLDFVGYLENISEDTARICERIGIRGNLPVKNASTKTDYRHMYTDELRDLVAERLADDIQFFGYNFDGYSTTRRLELQGDDDVRRAA